MVGSRRNVSTMKSPAERFADERALRRGAVVRIDDRHELVAPEATKFRRASDVRCDGAVGLDACGAGQVAPAFRIRHADDDYRSDCAQRDERVDGVDDVRKVFVEAAIRHVEHGKAGGVGRGIARGHVYVDASRSRRARAKGA